MVQYKSLISTQHPSHWKVVRNKAFLSITGEVVGKRANEFVLLSLTTNGVIVRDVESGKGKFPKDFDTYQVVKPNELVFCLFDIDETPRTVGIVEKEGMLTGAYTALKVNQNRAFPLFVYYYYIAVDNIKGLKPYYSGLRKTVRADKFLQIYIPLPPIAEQEKIVSYLEDKTSKIDAYVAEKEKEIELLQELKQKTIADAVTKGLNPEAKMKDSGISWIGDIPEHWEVKKIGSLFVERREKVSDKEYPALSVSKQGVTPQLDTAVKTDNGDNRKKVCKNDFVVNSRSDRKGSCGVSPYTGSVSLINIVLSPRENIEVQYFHYLFRSNDYIEEYYRIGRGIVADLWTTRYSEMRNIFVPLPPLDEQQAIVAYIEEKCQKIDKLASELQSEIDFLKEYKQRLIADVVTGQVNVQNL